VIPALRVGGITVIILVRVFALNALCVITVYVDAGGIMGYGATFVWRYIVETEKISCTLRKN
jgi:hypothetical protein